MIRVINSSAGVKADMSVCARVLVHVCVWTCVFGRGETGHKQTNVHRAPAEASDVASCPEGTPVCVRGGQGANMASVGYKRK